MNSRCYASFILSPIGDNVVVSLSDSFVNNHYAVPTGMKSK